ncbi:hypothetical protein LCGC14_1336810 [marine sediment metagenome]|uniref:Uncharacterized protein n=1 Tax=marine sediment metagenome TaxID=412755 RepID=A0A0F9MVQ3_9ZZZZ
MPYKYKLDEITKRFLKDPTSKRSRIFDFLDNHPNATTKILYERFGGISIIQKQLIRNYKSDFFKQKNPFIPQLKEIKNNTTPYTIKKHQDFEDKILKDRISAMRNFYS